MDNKTDITVAGDWSKPAQVLIEKVSEAVGGGFRPWQLKRVAKAQAEVAITVAKAEAKAREILNAANLDQSPVGLRAVQRMVTEEVRKQVNIESIAAQAAELLKCDARPDDVERDFISHLFDKASNTSDTEMQSLWASLLAGEANDPGSFSRRTIDLVGSLDKRDAETFTKFCSCCWMMANELTALTTTNSRIALDSELGVGFDDLLHLDSIGLIRFDSIGSFAKKFNATDLPVNLSLRYFGKPLIIHFTSEPVEVKVGATVLTKAGAELAKISGASSNESVFDATLGDLIGSNLVVLSPLIK